MPDKITTIKKNLQSRIGSKITLVAQTGRKHRIERKGILAEIYPAVFVVDLDQEENAFERVSYSYTDILTHTVKIEFMEEECEEEVV